MGKSMRKFKIIFMCILLSMSISSCNNKTESKFFINILEGFEISDIVLFNDAVYAGGFEGVFEINPETYEVNKLDVELFLVKALVVDEGILYIGHEAGITTYDGDIFETFLDETSGVEDVRVNTLMMDANNQLWAGTFAGALTYSNEKWKSITKEDGLLDDTVYLILEDHTGGILFGHYASSIGGISYLNNGKWTYFTVEEGLPHNYITAGLVENEKIYIATGFYELGGVAVFRVEKDTLIIDDTIVKKWGENGYKARSLYLDDDRLWVGTEYNGICIVDHEEFTRWDSEDGLISNEVKAIYFDKNQRIWLGTRNGISIANKRDL